MQIKICNAAERFNNISFSNEVTTGMSMSVFSTYTCPQCAEKIGFTKDHFEKRSKLNFSNLSSEYRLEFDAWEKKNKMGENYYLDWHCPKCNLAARVYIKFWAGGRHGDAGVNLLQVLEAV
ncbi:MAG: hypothetical protein HQL22_09530 [Candidatus Omnitrophica bacterium]|nr:hypothetical protein [Candidatus Omnitrophota bacterium]